MTLPPPAWALIYELVAAGLCWSAGWPVVRGLPVVPVGVVLVALGAALAIWAALLFRREGTELNPTSESNRKLVIAGPFKLTRNPMYLGLVCVTLGLAFWVGAWPMFLPPLATFATANWNHIPFEEAKMRRQFGAEFDAYTQRVRRWV